MELIDLLYFCVIGANLILGLVILLRGRPSAVNFTFAALAFFIAFWSYSTYVANTIAYLRDPAILFWAKMANVASFPIPSLFLYFITAFPEKPKIPLWQTVLIFIPVPLLMLLLAYDRILKAVEFLPNGSIDLVFGDLYGLFVAYFVSYFLLSFLMLIKKHKKLKGVARMQIRYVSIGAAVPILIGSFTNLFLPLLNVSYAWHEYHMIGTLSPVFFTIMVSSAIIQYRFMELRTILGKSIVYSVMAGFISVLYFGFVYIAARFFQALSGNYSFIIGILLFFLFVLIFEPLKNKLEEWVDRLFFRTKFDYEKTLKETSMAMSLISDRDRLLKLTAKLVKRRMNLSGAALFLFDQKNDKFTAKAAEGTSKDLISYTLSSNYPIIEFMEKTRKPVSKYELERQVSDILMSPDDISEIKAVLADLEKLKAGLAVPSILKNETLAFLCLGPKLSEEPFSIEDVNFLITLANQNAIFIENAVLLEKEKDSIKIIADAEAREKYTEMLENTNRQLVETRQELVKSERLSTVTMLAISLQHEINNPLTSVLAQTQGLLMKMDKEPGCLSEEFIKDRIKTVERETIRIRDLLRNLARITDPIVKEYMPGVDMIDINASAGNQ
ncbi:MAG: histidine kinase N-terminal 7TM domain-containing protein [Candidatus Margulisiibacteriota bacterium]